MCCSSVKESTTAKDVKSAAKATPEKEALLCLSVFFHRYLAVIYGDLGLDLVSVSLLDEIARHNLEPFAKAGGPGFPRDAQEMKLMQGCNAFSLSQATGVPRETARRKVKELVELGLIELHNRKGLFITSRWMDRVSREEAAGVLAEFRAVAWRLDKILSE